MPDSTWVPEGNLAGFVWGRKSVILGVWAAPGAQESIKKCGGEAPHIFEGFPGPPGPPRLPKWPISDPDKNPARLPSGTQLLGQVFARLAHRLEAPK